MILLLAKDTLMDIDRFTSSLFEARDYYQNIIDQALSRLEHINALLEDLGSEQPLNTTSHLQLNIDARPVRKIAEALPQSQTNNGVLNNFSAKTDFEESNQSLEAAGIKRKQVQETLDSDSQVQTKVTPRSQTSPIRDAESIASFSAPEDATDEESVNGYASQNSLVEPTTKQEANQKPTQQQSKALESSKKSSSNARNKRLPQRPRSINIPFIPKLEGMKLGDAILTVLLENPETISHTDFIVRAVYGELEGNSLRTAKDRVTKELSRGYILGRWYRLPDTPGYYTVSKQLTQSRNS